MINPELPGIPETGQALLYAKLDEYNQGYMSYKEVGAYFVILPRPGHPTYLAWVYFPSFGKNRLLFIHGLSADINEPLRMVSTLLFFPRRRLPIVEYSKERMQSNGDDTTSFGRYHEHYLYEILRIDPAYLSWITYKYTPKVPKQERLIAIAQVYHLVHLDIMQRKTRQKREASRFLGSEGEKLESLNLEVVKVRLEDDLYRTGVVGSAVQFFVRRIVTLTDPSGNLTIMKIFPKTPGLVSCQLPTLEYRFRPGEIVHIASARVARTYESYDSKYTRLSHVKFRQVS